MTRTILSAAALLGGVVALAGLPRATARVELGHDALQDEELGLCVFVTRPRCLTGLLEAPFDHREVGERQLAWRILKRFLASSRSEPP